jgi:hypothetical protein
MYRFPENFDTDLLIGLKLEMICVAAYQITLHFGEASNLRIESKVELRTSVEPKLIYDAHDNFVDSIMFSSIERSIIAALILPDQSLYLAFEGGAIFQISAYSNYESFHVNVLGHEFII